MSVLERSKPPRAPVRRDPARHDLPGEYTWDLEFSLEKLDVQLGTPVDREVFREGVKRVAGELSKRSQLGYQAFMQYTPDGEVIARFPTHKEMMQNNRFLHTAESMAVAARMARSAGLDNRAVFMVALVLLGHDRKHSIGSHIGDQLLADIDFASEGDQELVDYMQRRRLYGDHDQRLLASLKDPTDPFTDFLNEIITPAELAQYKQIHQESRGALATIKSLADSAAYLDKDSQHCGYLAPEFPDYFAEQLVAVRGGISLRDFRRGTDIITRFMMYRDRMFQVQYFNPFNQLIERMQLRALMLYLQHARQGQERITTLHNLLERSDPAAFSNVRIRTIVEQWEVGLSFFGVPYPLAEIAKIEPEVVDGQIVVTGLESPRKGIEISMGAGVSFSAVAKSRQPKTARVPHLHNGSFMVFEPTGDFFEALQPTLQRYARINPDWVDGEIVSFLKDVYSRKLHGLLGEEMTRLYRVAEVVATMAEKYPPEYKLSEFLKPVRAR